MSDNLCPLCGGALLDSECECCGWHSRIYWEEKAREGAEMVMDAIEEITSAHHHLHMAWVTNHGYKHPNDITDPDLLDRLVKWHSDFTNEGADE